MENFFFFFCALGLNADIQSYILPYTGYYGNPLNKYIRHYEGLSYDTDLVHHRHQRAKRAVSHEDRFLHLEFHAHGRFVFPEVLLVHKLSEIIQFRATQVPYMTEKNLRACSKSIYSSIMGQSLDVNVYLVTVQEKEMYSK